MIDRNTHTHKHKHKHHIRVRSLRGNGMDSGSYQLSEVSTCQNQKYNVIKMLSYVLDHDKPIEMNSNGLFVPSKWPRMETKLKFTVKAYPHDRDPLFQAYSSTGLVFKHWKAVHKKVIIQSQFLWIEKRVISHTQFVCKYFSTIKFPWKYNEESF